LVIKSEHLIYEPGNTARNPITKLNDYFYHANSLAREAQQRVTFWIVEHVCKLRSSKPIQGVIWVNDEYPD